MIYHFLLYKPKNIEGGRFRSDVIEIPVNERILWNMHTVCDLLCFITAK